MPIKRYIKLSVLVCLLALASCATTKNIIDMGMVDSLIGNVPFFPQEEFQCGPASLAGVLNYRGISVEPQEISEAIYSPTAKGTLSIDLLLYANKRGLRGHRYRGSIDDIKKRIDNGDPLIVLVDLGISLYKVHHFMVITGYADNGIIANSGREEGKFIPIKKFIRTWEKTDYWTLLITKDID